MFTAYSSNMNMASDAASAPACQSARAAVPMDAAH